MSSTLAGYCTCRRLSSLNPLVTEIRHVLATPPVIRRQSVLHRLGLVDMSMETTTMSEMNMDMTAATPTSILKSRNTTNVCVGDDVSDYCRMSISWI